jgi:hypothetical protein
MLWIEIAIAVIVLALAGRKPRRERVWDETRKGWDDPHDAL